MQDAIAAGLADAARAPFEPGAAARCRRAPTTDGAVPRHSRSGLRRLAAAAAATLALVVSAGPTVLAAAAPEPPAGSGMFRDHHGPVLHTIQLHLIYWGSPWTSVRAPNPRAEQITAAARTMLAGRYLTGLAQYRGIGRGVLRGSTLITSSDPPAGVTDEQVGAFVDAQIDAGTVPGPDPDNQTLYAVVLPAGISAGGDSGFAGEHYYYTRHGRRIHYLWTAKSDSLTGATWILSHELVESATDPEGSGFRGIPGTCHQDGWCEIADVCSASTVLDGVTVWSYWSNQAGGCVFPDRPQRQPSGHHSGRLATTLWSPWLRGPPRRTV